MSKSHRRIWGEGRGGLGPPLEKLLSLAGQKRELGRTEMGAWQDKNGSLAGQKWEAWQKIISNTPHFESFSVIFVCLLPLLVGFCHTFLYFSHFCLFFSHLSSNLSISRTVWQDSLAEKLGTAAWQNKWPPLAGRNFGRMGLNFGRMKLLAPPKKWPRYAYVPGVPRCHCTGYSRLYGAGQGPSLHPRLHPHVVYLQPEGLLVHRVDMLICWY